jgi:hypothetical protein
LAFLALGAAAMGLGCPAFNQQNRDIDRTPITDVGTGASIIYPGQSAPTYQGPYHPRQSGRPAFGNQPAPGATSTVNPTAPPQQPPPGSARVTPAPEGSTRGSVSGAPPPARGSNITMIGGNTTEAEYHLSVDEKPAWWKYVTLPFAVVAAPFKYAIDSVTPEPEAGPEIPSLENAPPPPPKPPPANDHSSQSPQAPQVQASAPLSNDYESRAIRQLERELAQRTPAPPPTSAGTPSSGGAGASSFAAELARLRSSASQPSQTTPPTEVASARPLAGARNDLPTLAREAGTAARETAAAQPDPTLAAASGHVDRDGDGRTDHWIYRERGEIKRELLDDDFDGRPDRTLHYDLTTHQVRAIEEDGDGDGSTDTWTAVRDGAIVRRRNDANGDGHVDTWSFFRDGELSRLERDSNGDGFRDRVTRYENGRLVREDEDDDADGRAETVRYYDESERVSRLEEDTNRDGSIDMVTHYREGRLYRREILDASALAPSPSMTEHN